MTVRWPPEAADDLAAIVEFIWKQNPSAAERVARAIYEGIASLEIVPQFRTLWQDGGYEGVGVCAVAVYCGVSSAG
jgi:plasmid stabilization system protein ParE